LGWGGGKREKGNKKSNVAGSGMKKREKVRNFCVPLGTF